MLNLAQVIRETREMKPKEQVRVELPVKWADCIQAVNRLSGDYMREVLDHKDRAKSSRQGKVERIEVSFGYTNGYKTDLVVYQNLQGEVKKAFYVALNQQLNKAYIRDLMGGDL